uniref:Centromere protein I n=1 Tax=Varanus komodoensis TaxID=61221 RepID=A0A8D2L6S7_VARKO
NFCKCYNTTVGMPCQQKIKNRIPLKNEVLQVHLMTVETIAQEKGLTPEAIDSVLNIALSGKFAEAVNTRLLKNLIPSSAIREDSIISAVSWLCVGKCSRNTQVIFLKWLIAMFDFIDQKEKINALYGCFFRIIIDLHLLAFSPVKPFRVRKLLDLQARMGAEPPLQALLSMYKSFAPEMVSVTLPTNAKIRFRNSENMWKTAISNVKRRIYGMPTSQPNLVGTGCVQAQKRKWNVKLALPVCSSKSGYSNDSQKSDYTYLTHTKFFPVEQLRTFPQLLQNIRCLELPSRIGSILGSPLLLHYINCVKDDSIYQRMYYWMGQTFREECPWYKIENQQYELEFKDFLENVLEAESFLQEGFSSCEEFLYRSLPFWDGCCCQSQVLQLVSWIPLSTFSEMKPYLCKPLTQLFLTSSIYFKCGVLESLRELLLNWLNWHIMPLTWMQLLNTTFSGLVNSVAEFIHFVGWLSTLALRLEKNSAFLMHFILDFYEIVCDVYQKFNLPLVVMPPAGVFYPALLSMDCVTVDRLCHIMYRYRTNLIAAKQNQKTMLQFKFSSQTCKEYNQYITAIVGCLWTSNVFQKDNHPQGLNVDQAVLEKTRVQDYRKGLNIVYHPALTGYAILFLKQVGRFFIITILRLCPTIFQNSLQHLCISPTKTSRNPYPCCSCLLPLASVLDWHLLFSSPGGAVMQKINRLAEHSQSCFLSR